MNQRIPRRDVISRTPGPAITTAGDGLEGSYTATIHAAPSDGACRVVIPELDMLRYRTAICSPSFTGDIGDSVLVTFDENKDPWIVVNASR